MIRLFQVCVVVVWVTAAVAAAVGSQSEPNTPVQQVEKQKLPKYEYGYVVSDKEGNAQGHVESRDGVYALGRYYVNAPNGSGQKVTYFADDLGYHPLVTYASTASRTQFAMGDKAIAALNDNVPVSNGIEVRATVATPAPVRLVSPGDTYTSINVVADVQQPSEILVPPTYTANIQNAYTPTIVGSSTEAANDLNQQNVEEPGTETGITITATTEFSAGRQTILHIPRLKQLLKLATEDTGANRTRRENGTTEVYLTTTMRPIVVSGKNRGPEVSAVVTSNRGQSGYNAIDDPELAYLTNPLTPPPPPPSAQDSASQSSDSITLSQGGGVFDEGRNSVDQLASLQAGLSLISSESAKSIEESIEAEPVRYKTVVDIQEGISYDVKQNADGTLSLGTQFGDRIRSGQATLGQATPVPSTTPITPAQFRGLAYERRLVHPEAEEVVREKDPVLRQQKQENLLLKQEAELLAVQKSIEQLQEQIVSQIDAEHAEQEKKHEAAESTQKVEDQDQNSIQSSNNPVQVPAAEAVKAAVENVETPVVLSVQQQPLVVPVQQEPVVVPIHQQHVPVVPVQSEPAAVGVQLQVDRESIGNNQIEALPHRTVKSQNLAGILTFSDAGPSSSAFEKDTFDLVPPPIDSGHDTVVSAPIEHETPVAAPVQDEVHVSDTHEALVPPIRDTHDAPVLVEPYPIEEEPSKLLPAAPTPTLFPVKVESPPVIVEKPTLVESTKVVEVEKPVVVKEPVEYTKVVQVEKPVPVLQPYPVEVTKYVHVDRPVPVPQPIAVSHPVPVPVAVPHAVEVPVPHLIPVPEILPIALKEYYPVFVHKTKVVRPSTTRKPFKLFQPEPQFAGENPSKDDDIVMHFKSESPKTVVVKQHRQQQQQLHQSAPDFRFAGFSQDLQFSEEALRHAFEHHRGAGHRGQHRNRNVLKNLRIEYGFKPPLRPSVEITEEVKPSIYGPSVRSD